MARDREEIIELANALTNNICPDTLAIASNITIELSSMKKLAKALKVNITTRGLMLDEATIDDEGIALLVGGVQVNKCLPSSV